MAKIYTSAAELVGKTPLVEFKNVEKMVHSLLLSEDFPEAFSPYISELFFINKNK